MITLMLTRLAEKNISTEFAGDARESNSHPVHTGYRIVNQRPRRSRIAPLCYGEFSPRGRSTFRRLKGIPISLQSNINGQLKARGRLGFMRFSTLPAVNNCSIDQAYLRAATSHTRSVSPHYRVNIILKLVYLQRTDKHISQPHYISSISSQLSGKLQINLSRIHLN